MNYFNFHISVRFGLSYSFLRNYDIDSNISENVLNEDLKFITRRRERGERFER